MVVTRGQNVWKEGKVLGKGDQIYGIGKKKNRLDFGM